MSATLSPKDTRRFLRSLRVVSQTALARHAMVNPSMTASTTRFFALAAKGVADFAFPDAGLLSDDGLLLAKMLRAPDGSAEFVVQAQGAAGLTTFAERDAVLQLGGPVSVHARFDRRGAMRVALDSDDVAKADIANFEVTLVGAPR